MSKISLVCVLPYHYSKSTWSTPKETGEEPKEASMRMQIVPLTDKKWDWRWWWRKNKHNPRQSRSSSWLDNILTGTLRWRRRRMKGVSKPHFHDCLLSENWHKISYRANWLLSYKIISELWTLNEVLKWLKSYIKGQTFHHFKTCVTWFFKGKQWQSWIEVAGPTHDVVIQLGNFSNFMHQRCTFFAARLSEASSSKILF